MDRCPHCGVLLDARLVAAIKNPQMGESCPRRSKRVEPVKASNPNRVASWMLVAAIMREGLAS